MIDFKKLGEAKQGGIRKPYFEADQKLVVVCTLFNDHKGPKGHNCVFEFRVLEGTLPAGTERAYIVSMDEAKFPYTKLKAIACAANGGEFDGLSEDDKAKMLMEKKSLAAIIERDLEVKGEKMALMLQNLVGVKLALQTYAGKVGKNGQPFVNLQWSHVPGQTAESVQQMRKELRSDEAPF